MDSHQPMAILASDTSLVLESCVIRKVYEVRELRVKTEVKHTLVAIGEKCQKMLEFDLNRNSATPTASRDK